MAVSDASWARIAHASQDALGLLGFDVRDRCLPDEPHPCGGGFAEHTAVHLGALMAVIDHQLKHLGAGGVQQAAEAERHITGILDRDCARRHPAPEWLAGQGDSIDQRRAAARAASVPRRDP